MTRYQIGTSEVPAVSTRPHRPPTYPWTQIHQGARDTYFQVEIAEKDASKRQVAITASGKYFCEHNAPSLKVVSRRVRTGNKLVLRFWLKDKTWGKREVVQAVREEPALAGVA